MKSKKIHPSNQSLNDSTDEKAEEKPPSNFFWKREKRFENGDDDQTGSWFRYDEATDDVRIDEDQVERANRRNEKSKFEIFLAKIKDEDWGGEGEEDEGRTDEDEELLLKTPHGLLLKPNPQRPSLLLWDLFLFLLDFLQIYSLLQSMSLRWIWPKAWIDATSFVFLFNFDLWDISRVHSNSTYQNARGFVSDSAQFPVHYIVWILCWLLLIFVVFAGFFIGRKWTKRRRVRLPYLKRAWIEHALVIGIQVVALPVGVAMGRLFQCQPESSRVDSINELTCWQGIHWLLVIVFFPIYALIFIATPVWMIKNIRMQVFSYAPESHETFLRLKETEYANGVDILWAVSRLYLFSSFNRKSIYFRPILLVIKFLLVVASSALFNHLVEQAVFCCLLLFLTSCGILIFRPHRIPLFNAFLFVNFLILSIDALIGALLAKFGVWNNMSALFTLEYATYELIIANLLWFFLVTPMILYVIARRFSLCSVKRKSMWPVLTEDSLNKLDEQTQIYTKQVIKARLLLDRSMAMPISFIPIHELANEIHVINAFCREAEVLDHPMQQTLWDVLDDLIEAHNSASSSSLFAESVKPSIRKTAAEFLQMMPALARRLNERDGDFILMKPKRKKILLKLFIYGMFLRLYETVLVKRKKNPAVPKLALGKATGESMA